ncbi:type IX secretion system outer membrane channel protein PorV [Hymenobacter busanensis]|uniref:Type IX secretion system outer membrane channel protein PorV n=1 Tax=Hymenobacter busanensis TaxID=2607656 RepID=A0A7L4ZY12_9BACT|nr:type IX secretion system outer membrane channel protein PorV [Hymenobacter busanensis]KAA9325271.1 type IX secretion system outer membrane channel protein PorV [Hymenobacter busanensis]QHJ07736.1 type IX secretion system outer membrane channel protein PorV [Hymenobacter busanensis]
MTASPSTVRRVLVPALVLGASLAAHAQQSANAITTAVPILTVSPDSRGAALGDAGVATSPDANAAFYNPGKLGFETAPYGVSASYSPWLRAITDDMGLAGLSGYKKFGERGALAASLMYFDLGTINFRGEKNDDLGNFNPKEYAFSLAYGQQLSEKFGIGVAARFIHSNLSVANGATTDSRPGNAAAVDLGVYYNTDLSLGASEYNLALGGAITNMGNKIAYTKADQADFLPTNLRLGTAITRELDAYNKITLTVDANKLLVPTPYYIDGYIRGSNAATDLQIKEKNDAIARKPVFSGMLSSFTDAPGGFKEELREINLSAGAEYWYNDLLAARVGYFYENPVKGDRQYLSLGLGLRYQVFGVDAAYLVPNSRNNPLSNTVRVSLHFNFNGQDNSSPVDSGIPSN